MRAVFAIGALLLLAGGLADATVYYVDASRPDNTGAGTSWGTAKKTIQAGINAGAGTDEVWVKGASYAEVITLRSNCSLYGGFAGTEFLRSERDYVANVTTIDASSIAAPNHVVTINGITNSRLDGFTVTGGRANADTSPQNCGGGVYCTNANNTNVIANCIITGNTAHGPDGISGSIHGKAGYGGGVYCASSSPVFTACTISNNSAIGGNGYSSNGGGAGAWGGGVYATGFSSSFTDCMVTGNAATGGNSGGYNGNGGDGVGAGMFFTASSILLVRTTVQTNTATGGVGGGTSCGPGSAWGGGIYCNAASSLHITEGTISSNTAQGGTGSYTFRDVQALGGGIYANASSLQIEGTTISTNVVLATTSSSAGASKGLGGGVCSENGGSVTFTESFLTGNTATGGRTDGYNGDTRGGGCYVYGAGPCVFTECTVNNNTCTAKSMSPGSGGGVSLHNCTTPSLTDCVITGNSSSAYAGGGGGLYVTGSAATVTRCSVEGNRASGYPGQGGGVCFVGCTTAAISSGYIRTNVSVSSYGGDGRGGGLYAETSSLYVTDCPVESNAGGETGSDTAGRGGGLYAVNSPVVSLSGCDFTSNTAYGGMTGDRDGYGGAIFLNACSSITIDDCPMRQNQALPCMLGYSVRGGALYIENCAPLVSDCPIEYNTAGPSSGNPRSPGYGGGVYLTGSSGAVFSNCAIRSNTAVGGSFANYTGYGGGVYSNNSSPQFTNCIIELNNAGGTLTNACGYGGGLYCTGSAAPSLNTCTVQWNIAVGKGNISGNSPRGGGIYCNGTSPALNLCHIDFNQISLSSTSSNSAVLGGGVYCDAGAAPVFTDCSVDGNRIFFVSSTTPGNNHAKGGAVYCNGASPVFARCALCSNSASAPTCAGWTGSTGKGMGGAVYCEGASPSFSQCVIGGNLAQGGGTTSTVSGAGDAGMGGAFYCTSTSAPQVVNCVISGNKAVGGIARNSSYTSGSGLGGGLYCDNSSPTFVNSSLDNNEAAAGMNYDSATAGAAAGGAVYCVNNSDPILKNLIAANSPKRAIYEASADSDPIVTNCLFRDNSDGDYFDENTTGYIGAAAINAIPDGQAANNVDGAPWFVMQGSGAVGGTWTAAPVYDSANNRTTLTNAGATYAVDAYAGRLINTDMTQRAQCLIASNSATQMVVVGDVTGYTASGDAYLLADYHLAPGSQAIDAGCSGAGVPGVDIDGNARPFDCPGYLPDGTGVEYDIGAYEVRVDYAPIVNSITRLESNPTNAALVRFLVTFSEIVTGVDSPDFALTAAGVSGASITGISGSGTTRTINVDTGTGDGTIRLDVLDDDSIRDITLNPLGGAGLGNGGFINGEVYTIDKTSPSVSMASTAPDPTRTSPIPVTVTFNEPVTGFIADDITPGNATVTGFSGSGADYSFNLNPIGQGAVTAEIDAGVCTDAVGNGNTTAAPLTRTFDSVAPTITGVAVQTGFTINATFSEDMNNASVLLASKYTASGAGRGTLSDHPSYVTDLGGHVYELTWAAGEMKIGGSVTITVSGVTDLAGNNIGSPNSATHVNGGLGVAPVVTVTHQETVNNKPRIEGTAVDAGGLGTVSVLVNSQAYDAVVTASGPGDYDWYADVASLLPDGEYDVVATATDLAGNAAGDTTTDDLHIEPGETLVVNSIERLGASPTNAALVQYAVTFSKEVEGVDLSDFALHEGGIPTASIPEASGSGHVWTVTVDTGVGDGVVQLDVLDDDSIRDTAYSRPLGGTGIGNGGFTDALQSYVIDKTRPGVYLGTPRNPTNEAHIPVTVTFDENVWGFDAADITPDHATVGGFTAISEAEYAFELMPNPENYQGAITADVAADAAQDAAGNGNIEALQVSVVYDSIPPTVSISPPSAGSTQTGPVDYAVTYEGADEVLLDAGNIHLVATGTAQGEITVWGAKDAFSRVVMIENITGAGTLGITIDAGTSWDEAGNFDLGPAGPAETFAVEHGLAVSGIVGLVFLGAVIILAGTITLRRKSQIES